jgi:hypothetical protein
MAGAAVLGGMLLAGSDVIPQRSFSGIMGGTLVANNTGTFFCAPVGTTHFNGASPICAGAIHAYSQQPFSLGGTLANLTANLDPAQAAGTATLTIFKNGGATGITCQIAATTTTCSDVTHTVTMGAGDLMSVQIVITAPANTIDSVNWSLSLASPS